MPNTASVRKTNMVQGGFRDCGSANIDIWRPGTNRGACEYESPIDVKSTEEDHTYSRLRAHGPATNNKQDAKHIGPVGDYEHFASSKL